MAEKRFVFDPSINHFQDVQTDKEYSEYNLDEVVELLNSQNKAITSLQNRVWILERKNQKERESHQKQYKRWSDVSKEKIEELSNQINHLESENKTLRIKVTMMEQIKPIRGVPKTIDVMVKPITEEEVEDTLREQHDTIQRQKRLIKVAEEVISNYAPIGLVSGFREAMDDCLLE